MTLCNTGTKTIHPRSQHSFSTPVVKGLTNRNTKKFRVNSIKILFYTRWYGISINFFIVARLNVSKFCTFFTNFSIGVRPIIERCNWRPLVVTFYRMLKIFLRDNIENLNSLLNHLVKSYCNILLYNTFNSF